MVEPLADKEDYNGRRVMLPFSLFAHNAQQQSTQTVHAQEEDAHGVMGRIFAALQKQSGGYKTGGYSISGQSMFLEADGIEPTILSSGGDGVEQYRRYSVYRQSILNMTSYRTTSPFTTHYGDLLKSSLEGVEAFAENLRGGQLSVNFPNTGLGRQMAQVAKVIQSRDVLGAERDGFFVQIGGFDSHGDFFDVRTHALPREAFARAFGTHCS
eukprot:2998457-Pleurochrysis_carterae.AAC.1